MARPSSQLVSQNYIIVAGLDLHYPGRRGPRQARRSGLDKLGRRRPRRLGASESVPLPRQPSLSYPLPVNRARKRDFLVVDPVVESGTDLPVPPRPMDYASTRLCGLRACGSHIAFPLEANVQRIS